MRKNFHAFLSYAGEDRSFVDQLAGALKARGFKIWHADSVLEPGDKLLESIEQGRADSIEMLARGDGTAIATFLSPQGPLVPVCRALVGRRQISRAALPPPRGWLG